MMGAGPGIVRAWRLLPGTTAGPAALGDPRRTALTAAVLLAALAAPSAMGWLLDPRLIQGTSVWSKPLKFELSFALHWLTIAWALPLLEAPARASVGLRRWVSAGAMAAVLEVGYISLQGARGRPSHFNFETPLETVLYYGLMGGAALVIMAATLAAGMWLWRHQDRRSGPGLRLGAVLGLVAGSLATLIVTAPLAAGAIDGPGPWVGGVRTNAAGLPLTGWSTTGGDLRVPHFFAAHMVQAMPMAGWVADRCLPERIRPLAVWSALAVAMFVVAATFAQAVSGIPLVER